jgi:hypothetical protein
MEPPMSTAAANSAHPIPSYFVVMIDYGRKGCEAIVDPSITRDGVLSRLVSREYDNVRFIHEVDGGAVSDVTLELQLEASALSMAEAA